MKTQEPPQPTELLRSVAGLYLFLAIVAVVWLGLRLGSIPLDLFLRPAQIPLDLTLGLAAGLLLAGGWALLRRFLILARQLEEELRTALGPLSAGDQWALALLSGFSEELLFRGAIQGALGWTAATVLFGLLHLGRGRAFLLWAASALVAGALLGGLVLWRGALLPAMTAHVVVNVLGLGRLRRSGPTEG